MEKCLSCGHREGVVKKNILNILRYSYLGAAWVFAFFLIFLLLEGYMKI